MACLNLSFLLSASQIEEFAFSLQSDVLDRLSYFFIDKCALDEGFAIFFFPLFFLFVPD